MATKKQNPLYNTGSNVAWVINGGTMIGSNTSKNSLMQAANPNTPITPIQINRPVENTTTQNTQTNNVVNTPQNDTKNQKISSTTNNNTKNGVITKTHTITPEKGSSLPEFDLSKAQEAEAKLAAGNIQTLGQKTAEQKLQESNPAYGVSGTGVVDTTWKVNEPSVTPTIDKAVTEQENIQAGAEKRIKGQEWIIDTSQQWLVWVGNELKQNLADYKKEYENQQILERLKIQKINEDDLLKARQELDRELANVGVTGYDTASMNAATRQKYNAFKAKEAAIIAHNSLLNGNIQAATAAIDGYYNNQEQYLRDQANNLNNLINSAYGELVRLTGIQKDAIATKLDLLSSEIKSEEKKKENIQEMKNDIDGFTRAMRDEGLSLSDDVDTQLSKYNKAVKTQATIDDLSSKYQDAFINPTDTLAQARMKLLLSPSFKTNFGTGVDIVTNSKTGEMLAYNKITGKYSTISAGLSNEELNALDVKDTIDYTLKLQDQFKANTKEVDTILDNADNFNIGWEQMNEAIKKGGSLSSAQAAMIIANNKMLDPTSVVREGEYNRISAQQSTWDNVKTLAKKLLTGGVITVEEAKSYKELTDKLTQVSLNKFAASMDTSLNTIKAIGLNPSMIFDATDIDRYKHAKYTTIESILADFPELTSSFAKIYENNKWITDSEMLESLIYLSGSELPGFKNVGSNTNTATTTNNGGSIAERTNNPWNIKWTGAKWQTDLGGVDSGIQGRRADGSLEPGTFVKFPSLEKGQIAQKLLLQAPLYANLTFDAAMKKWSNNGYGAELVKQLPANKLMKDMTPQELQYIINAMSARESGNKNFSQTNIK